MLKTEIKDLMDENISLLRENENLQVLFEDSIELLNEIYNVEKGLLSADLNKILDEISFFLIINNK